MKRKALFTLIVCLISACLLAGCGKGTSMADSEKEKVIIEVEPIPEEKAEDTEAEVTAAGNAMEESASSETVFCLADLNGWIFWFGSGAGGWSTEVCISPDGSFEGNYHDSDMGDSGDDYPNGTFYLSSFTGKLSEPKKVNEYTYSVQVESIELECEVGKEEIEDGIRYIYSEPYGMEDAEEILIYLPGAPVAELPEEYITWISYSMPDIEDGKLTYYGLYNVNPQNGFSSTDYSDQLSIDNELTDMEAQIDVLEEELQADDIKQLDMNLISEEIYQLWDDELNSIWSRLQEKLDEDAMATLLTEQRDWIAKKEAEVEAAGADYEGGSMRPAIIYGTAADLTRERVYTLAELLR